MRNDSLVLKHSTSSRERGSSNLPSSLHNKKILYEGCNLTLFKKIYSKSSEYYIDNKYENIFYNKIKNNNKISVASLLRVKNIKKYEGEETELTISEKDDTKNYICKNYIKIEGRIYFFKQNKTKQNKTYKIIDKDYMFDINDEVCIKKMIGYDCLYYRSIFKKKIGVTGSENYYGFFINKMLCGVFGIIASDFYTKLTEEYLFLNFSICATYTKEKITRLLYMVLSSKYGEAVLRKLNRMNTKRIKGYKSVLLGNNRAKNEKDIYTKIEKRENGKMIYIDFNKKSLNDIKRDYWNERNN